MTAVAGVPATYREWPAGPGLRRYVQCVWVAPPGGPESEPVLPDGCIDVIWNGIRLFVAGPDTAPVADAHEGAYAVGVRFPPGIGPLFLGLPAATLRDTRVDLGQLWSGTDRLADELARARSFSAACRLLEAAVGAHLRPGVQPDPVVEQASRRWAHDPASLQLPDLARDSGLSVRQLHRRFHLAVGYGPKRLQRILRFQAFLRHSGDWRSGDGRSGFAELALRCGYADQSHLTRETAVLAGRTPAQLAAARVPGGGVRIVQDGCSAAE